MVNDGLGVGLRIDDAANGEFKECGAVLVVC